MTSKTPPDAPFIIATRDDIKAAFSEVLAALNTQQAQPELLTTEALADYLGVSLSTVYREVKDGLPIARRGRPHLFNRAQVDQYFATKAKR